MFQVKVLEKKKNRSFRKTIWLDPWQEGAGVECILFWKKNYGYLDLPLPLGTPDKTKFHPWQFCKIVTPTIHPNCPKKFQGQKPRLMEISSLFLGQTRSCTFYNWPMKFPHAIPSILLEISCRQPPVAGWGFSGIAL